MKKSHIRPKEDQNLWNIFFSLLFVLVLGGGIYAMYSVYGGFPHSISLLDLVLLSLASFRITRLVVYDKITRFFRELFVEKREINVDGDSMIEIIPYTTGISATIYELLSCPWCIGMWAALIVTFAYYAFPWMWFVLLFLSIAGVASLIQIFANALGWTAENRKIRAQSKEDSA